MAEPADVFALGKSGDSTALAALLEADPQAAHRVDTDGSRHIALHWAAWYGRGLAIGELLRRGADIHAKSADASTPLHMAAAAGHAEVVRVLLGEGASLAAVDDDGRTPLVKAATLGAAQQSEAGGHAEVVAALLSERGTAAPPVALLAAERVVHWLAAAGELAPLQALLSNAALAADGGAAGEAGWLEARDRQGRTALAAAAKAGQAECCAALLQAGAALEPVDKAGATPYLCACFGGDDECEAVLKQAGCATNATDLFGNDAAAYRSKTLQRPGAAVPAVAAGLAPALSDGPPVRSCCQRLLFCFRRGGGGNRVHQMQEPLNQG